MNGQKIEYVSSIKCLGVTISSNPNFSFNASKDIANFYCSSNAILNALHKPDVCILMHLLYTNCVPVLTYACGVKTYSSREMQDCNNALNNAIRRIFTYNRWESVRVLRESLGYRSLTEIFNATASKFFDSLPSHPNSITCKFLSNWLVLRIDIYVCMFSVANLLTNKKITFVCPSDRWQSELPSDTFLPGNEICSEC